MLGSTIAFSSGMEHAQKARRGLSRRSLQDRAAASLAHPCASRCYFDRGDPSNGFRVHPSGPCLVLGSRCSVGFRPETNDRQRLVTRPDREWRPLASVSVRKWCLLMDPRYVKRDQITLSWQKSKLGPPVNAVWRTLVEPFCSKIVML